jgi:hypothetical protein
VILTLACVACPAIDTRLQSDCDGPFYPGNLSLLTPSSGIAGEALGIQLTSNTTFATMQCVNNSGWNASLQVPGGVAVVLQQMQPWQSVGDLYYWKLDIPGINLTTVSFPLLAVLTCWLVCCCKKRQL